MTRIYRLLDYELMLWAILELALLVLVRFVKLDADWTALLVGVAIGLGAAFPTCFAVIYFLTPERRQ